MIEKKTIGALIRAQASSDAGKRIYNRVNNNSVSIKNAVYEDYRMKTTYVLKALQNISKNKNSLFRFFVEEAEDQNGYDSFLVYFEYTTLNNETLQCSFHIPYYEGYVKGIHKFISPEKYETDWDRKDSSQSILKMLEDLKLRSKAS